MEGFQEAQLKVDRYIKENGGYWDPNSNLLRLVEEVGELCREFNHRFGAKKKKASESSKELEEEFGDVLFVLIAVANNVGVDLTSSLEKVLEKYLTRDKGRWTTNPDE